ncbi:hypothetical protein D3C85_1492940 [compost metagenome]
MTASPVVSPVGTPAPGAFGASVEVALSSPTIGADIYYTLDGTDPIAFGAIYAAPIEITSDVTIKAVAIRNGNVSTVASLVYTIT